VLVHGLGGRQSSWDPVLAGLAAARSVVTVDLPGHGTSPVLPGTVTLERLVDELRAFLEQQGLSDADLVGSSMGARMVLELARQGIGRHVVALDPGGFWSPVEKRVFGTSVQASFALVKALRPALPVLAGLRRDLDLIAVDATDDPANYRRLVEGAWITRRDGFYYMFFSGDNCCGPNIHYAALVARSRSATGPFEILPEQQGVILQRSARWIGPGHNSVIRDDEGTDWIVYHAVDARLTRTRPEDEVNTRRVMLIDKLVWSGGWPRVAGPSEGPQDGPVFRR